MLPEILMVSSIDWSLCGTETTRQPKHRNRNITKSSCPGTFAVTLSVNYGHDFLAARVILMPGIGC